MERIPDLENELQEIQNSMVMEETEIECQHLKYIFNYCYMTIYS